ERTAVRDAERDAALAPYLHGVFGGDATGGDAVFHRADLDCTRCHATEEGESARVGPNLHGLGRRLTHLQILESIVAPNRRTAPGFEGTVLFVVDGTSLAGRVLEETPEQVVVQNARGEVYEVPASSIESRRADLSAMPEGLAKGIARTEMRDLVEYL